MRNRRYPPAFLRYLKPRLMNFTRPGFWGTAIFLSLVGLVIKEYSIRPSLLTGGASKPVATQPQPNSTLTAEDRAIVADIDNLPILNYDSAQVLEETLEAAEVNSQPKKNNNKNPLEEALSKQKTASEAQANALKTPASTQKTNNPFLTQADKLLQLTNVQQNNRFSSLNALNSPSLQLVNTDLYSNSNQANTRRRDVTDDRRVTINPLEAALNQTNVNQNSQYLTNAYSTLSPLPTSLNQSFNSNQSNISNITNSNFNSTNSFGQSLSVNTLNRLPNQGFTQPYTPSTNLMTTGINSATNTTGFAQPNTSSASFVAQPTVTTSPQGNYSNFNNNQPLTNTAITTPVTTIQTYSSVTPPQTNVSPNTQIGGSAITNQGLQQPSQVQPYNNLPSPAQIPNPYPNPAQAIR